MVRSKFLQTKNQALKRKSPKDEIITILVPFNPWWQKSTKCKAGFTKNIFTEDKCFVKTDDLIPFKIKRASMLASIIHLLFVVYTVMIFIRVVGSWFPNWQHHSFMRFIHHYTEPYLGLIRRIIPPIGGFLDLSPIIGFLLLGILEQIILMILP